jgi:hypothetical protein
VSHLILIFLYMDKVVLYQNHLDQLQPILLELKNFPHLTYCCIQQIEKLMVQIKIFHFLRKFRYFFAMKNITSPMGVIFKTG